MPKRYIDQDSKKLYIDLLLELKSHKEIVDFLESLFSSSEVKDHSRRTMAAKILINGGTYEDVEEIMGMSSNTINKINFKTKGSPTLNKLLSDD